MMHPLKVSCVVQTFAMARCSDFREKKTRRRWSKEERRTMVESFIKKYRNLNNGNFPSLNITHKEVGGSFYTVREIVRDIIQENKVLGPGSLTLQELDFEGCVEEDTVSLSMNINGIGQNHMEGHSFLSENQISTESFESAKSETQNNCAISQIGCGESSDHLDKNLGPIGLDENLMNIETLDILEAHVHTYPDDQDESLRDCNNQVEHLVPLLETVSEFHPSSVASMDKYDTRGKSNNTPVITSLVAEINEVLEAPESTETKILFDSGRNSSSALYQDCSNSNITDVFPLTSAVTSICGSDRRPLEEDLTSPVEEFGTNNSSEVDKESVSFDNGPAMKSLEPKHDPMKINEAPETRQVHPLSQSFGTAKIEPQLVLQPSKSVGRSMNAPAFPDVDGTMNQTGDIAMNSDNSHISSSVLLEHANNESEKTEETNPVWAAMKAFVAAVFKFWTE